MGSKPSCFLICTDSGSKIDDEKALESSVRQSQRLQMQLNSIERSNRSGYLRDQDIEDIRADCQRKSFEIETSTDKAMKAQNAHSGLVGNSPVHVYLTLQELLDQSILSEDPNYSISEDPYKKPYNLVDVVKEKKSINS